MFNMFINAFLYIQISFKFVQIPETISIDLTSYLYWPCELRLLYCKVDKVAGRDDRLRHWTV